MRHYRFYLLSLLGVLVAGLFGSVSPASAQLAPSCTDVTVQSGDSLSSIASRYLGNLSAYPQIVEATNAKAASDASYTRIADVNNVSVGWKLCVPSNGGNGGNGSSRPAIAPVIIPTPTASLTLPTTEAEPRSVREYFADRWDGTGPFPLTIEYLRRQRYPGSEIVIEQTLAPGSNYNRYLVSYRSEGLKINAYMTVPTGKKPATGWPAILFNHGYIPPEIYRSTERYIAYVDGFARNGYLVLRADYRGHAFSEGKANGAYGAPDYTIDVLNALASVKRYADVDPQRIGMWGHSLGGYITLRTMVTNQDIKAGVIWAGVVGSYSDMLNNWRRPVPVSIPQRARRWRQLFVNEFGTPEQNPQFWNSVSANSYLGDLSGPIQLHHGTADEDVPTEFSATLYDQVQAVSKPVEYYTYPGDNHNINNYFNVAMQRSVAFFDEHVK